MPTTMTLWRMRDDGSIVAVEGSRIESEEQIETAIESAPEVLGIDVMVVGRQTRTTSGPLDLLAIDDSGRLAVIEIKRDRTPREVVAQAIDYAAWVANLDFEEVAEIYREYRSRNNETGDLTSDFESHFGAELDYLAETPRMIIVASRLDDSTERMIEFLGSAFDMPINAVLFQPFEGGLIGRTWLIPEEVEGRGSRRRSARSGQRRDESRQFWDKWLPVASEILPDIALPEKGRAHSYISRSIESGVPATITFLVSQSDAFAEIQLGDEDPELNMRWLAKIRSHQSQIETDFGGALHWRELTKLATRRTKISAPRTTITSKKEPTESELRELAGQGRRLIDAVRSHLRATYEQVSEANHGA